MSANPVRVSGLDLDVDNSATRTVVRCTGRITSGTIEGLKEVVRPLIAESRAVVLDLSNVSYVDSTGLGFMAAVCVSAKAANCELKLINLSVHVQEIFSLTRLGELLAEGREPSDFEMP